MVCATESLGDGHGWLCQAASPSRRDRGRTSCGCERGRPTPAASGKRPGKRHVGVTGPSSRSPSSSRTPAADATGQSGRGADAAKSMRPPLAGSEPCVPELTGPRAATRREGPTARRSGEVTRGRGNAWLTSPETSRGRQPQTDRHSPVGSGGPSAVGQGMLPVREGALSSAGPPLPPETRSDSTRFPSTPPRTPPVWAGDAPVTGGGPPRGRPRAPGTSPCGPDLSNKVFSKGSCGHLEGCRMRSLLALQRESS